MTESRTTGGSRRRGWSRITGNLLLAGVGLLASVFVCELVLRMLGVRYTVYVWTDPIRGVAHIPGVKGRTIRINGDGWRGPEVTLERPAGTYRVALLGDSYIEAFEVPFEETVGEVLERRLSALRGTPVEVLNFGQGGSGTTQELLTLQHEVWKYSPDLVLLGVTTGNDISDNHRALKKSDYVPYHVYKDGKLVVDTSFLRSRGYRSRAAGTRRWAWLVQHSRLAQLVNRVRHLSRKGQRQQRNAGDAPGVEVGMRDEVQLPPASPVWQEAWRVTEGVLRLMRDECRAKGTPFAIITLTRGIQVTPDREKKERFMRQLGVDDLYYPERRLAEFGRREGIPVLNLAPPMAEEAEQRQVYFHAYRDSLGIGHWNKEGHRVAGALIASWVAQLGPDLTAR